MRILIQTFAAAIIVLSSTSVQSTSLKSLNLHYDETEAGVGTQTMRYILNDQFLRIDGGEANTDFILLDRKKQTVYSVNHEDQTILKITNKPWQSPAYEFEVSVEEHALLDAPKVFDKQVFSYQVKAKGEVCTQVLLVKNMHIGYLKSLQEFQTIMSGQQVATLDNTPKELHTPCFLVDQVFHKADYYDIGLPIQISYSREYSKFLRGIEEKEMDGTLFVLPEKYEEFLPFTQ